MSTEATLQAVLLFVPTLTLVLLHWRTRSAARPGMDTLRVQRALGRPPRILRGGAQERWIYPGRTVITFVCGRVERVRRL